MDAEKLLLRVTEDHHKFLLGLPKPLEKYILDTYEIDLSSTYAGLPIKNPFGKASGQLSLNVTQVQRDAEAGLGFIVLKTLIAQDETGEQSMQAWAIPETKMLVERIRGSRRDVRNEDGWTVTWKGRGWSDSFEDYLTFFGDALGVTAKPNALVVPSVKFHLPSLEETEWKEDEYEYTLNKLLEVWTQHRKGPMPIEKDFSPTLAGDENFSKRRERVVEWLVKVPELVRKYGGERIRLGLKIFNALDEDNFQREMLSACLNAPIKADHLIYGNRLFDPTKEYDGKRGVAYGGPDLSSRNLDILDIYTAKHNRLPISATGNITTGKTAFEYLKRGATSFQMHTVFQLPDPEFAMNRGTKPERVLHHLLFNPANGFIRSVLEARMAVELPLGLTIPQLAEKLVQLRAAGTLMP